MNTGRWLGCLCRRGPRIEKDAPLSEYRAHLPDGLELTEPLVKLIQHWQLRRHELLYFWNIFHKLDIDENGAIDPLEFFLFLNEPRTRVLNYIIPIIANDPAEYGKMNFSSWMLAVFGFCFMTNDELIQHVFQRYDSTGTGRILQNDLYKFMKQMHADNPLFPKDIVIQMSAQLDLAGYFDYSTFRQTTFRYPMFFYPITRIQHAMRQRLITPKLFAALDVRTRDIYYQRAPGDRPPLYHVRKLRTAVRTLAASLPCWRPKQEEVERRRERRELIRREKAEVLRRREGGVGGELYEEKKAEREFHRMRRRRRVGQATPRVDGQEDEDEEEEEEELPSAVRRKYFGTDMKREDEAERIGVIMRRLKDVVHSTAPDMYDSDEDTDADHFEDRELDEYEDARHEDT